MPALGGWQVHTINVLTEEHLHVSWLRYPLPPNVLYTTTTLHSNQPIQMMAESAGRIVDATPHEPPPASMLQKTFRC